MLVTVDALHDEERGLEGEQEAVRQYERDDGSALPAAAETLLGVTVGDVLAVINAPAQSDTTSPSYFVEGYTETIGPESYSITFNLSPTYPTLNTFVLDDADRGELDAGSESSAVSCAGATALP